MPDSDYRALARYRDCQDRITARWAQFQAMRNDRLRHEKEAEKVAEAILEDLFTEVLDWSKGDVAYQVDYADMVLTQNLVKYLVIEAKRPNTLWPDRRSLEMAIDQARRYAAEQNVPRIAASDGRFLYAADIISGAPRARVLVDLGSPTAPSSLWWLSVHGIYRPCDEPVAFAEEQAPNLTAGSPSATALLDPKYNLPCSCFAYAGDASDPRTWKLPYRLADGRIDTRRLPKAIQALISNYRGTKVRGIPEQALPFVYQTLARAATEAGRMPPDPSDTNGIYYKLARVLEQCGVGSADGENSKLS